MSNQSTSRRRWTATISGWLAPAVGAALLASCGGGSDENKIGLVACDTTSMQQQFNSGDTQVLLAQYFQKDALLKLPNSPIADAAAIRAAANVCLVKILVRGGNTAEPPTEPSYSAGIGIEVYLPDKESWNDRIRTYGSGGWAGGYHTDITRLGQNAGQGDQKLNQAVGKGYVVSHSDAGHSGMQGGPNGTGVANNGGGEGEWAMKSDGTNNAPLWVDYSENSLHVTAVKTKEVVLAYYGRAQKYAYFDGFSTGGRQGWKLAQKYPTDYDGILAGAPAFNWARFSYGSVFPQVVMQQDLGRPITPLKLGSVNGRAIAACDTLNIGLLLNPQACTYDPTKDAAAICTSSTTIGGTAGTNNDASTCLSLAEAKTVNKIWYGMTRDGRYTDPATDLGNATSPNAANQQAWFGYARGTILAGNFPTLLTGNSVNGNAAALSIPAELVALTLDNPTYATPNFYNKTGNGADAWKSLSYAQFASAMDLAVRWSAERWSNIDTDSTDLSGLRASGHKVIHYHGLADSAIVPQGSINYEERAAAAVGGVGELQKSVRFYLIPGLGHISSFTFSGQYDKADPNRQLNVNLVPLPQGSNNPADQTKPGRDEMFNALMAWVENGVVPGTLQVSSPDSSVGMPLCLYPTRIAVKAGAVDLKSAASYECK